MLLDNLLRNAVTHGAPPGGAPEVRVVLDADDSHWRLAISDAGPGIPPEDRERVLGRFVRGRGGSATGSGIGLALVAQQAALHGGAVAIDDAPEGGARVTVRAPREPAAK